jgi:glycosyltransferase involved in cell wall biosynthesis
MREGSPTVSVIVPVYNAERYLGEALESVLAQTYSDYEVIVVNDGSTDGSEQVALGFGDRIRYIRQENAGPGAARNRGIELARGELIAFLDADDLWLPGKLAAQVEFMETHPGVVLSVVNYGLRVDGKDPPGGRWRLPSGGHWWVAPSAFLAYRDRYVPSSPATMVRTGCLRKLGGFPTDVHYGEDVYTWFRVGTLGKWAFGGEVLCRIRFHQESLTGRRGFDTTASDLLFDRLRQLAMDQGTPADYAAWQDIHYRGLFQYVKRAILEGETEAARRYVSKRQRYLKWRHQAALLGLLICPGLVRKLHQVLKG